jgi:hypothetical protein
LLPSLHRLAAVGGVYDEELPPEVRDLIPHHLADAREAARLARSNVASALSYAHHPDPPRAWRTLAAAHHLPYPAEAVDYASFVQGVDERDDLSTYGPRYLRFVRMMRPHPNWAVMAFCLKVGNLVYFDLVMRMTLAGRLPLEFGPPAAPEYAAAFRDAVDEWRHNESLVRWSDDNFGEINPRPFADETNGDVRWYASFAGTRAIHRSVTTRDKDRDTEHRMRLIQVVFRARRGSTDVDTDELEDVEESDGGEA